jgi:hypothetical protein
MNEITGEIWDWLGKAVIAITTNGYLSKRGTAVFGNGCAAQARERFPDLPERVGRILGSRGNHVAFLGDGLVTFPVEESPWALPDYWIIRRSARELREMADREGWQTVVVPRPGCGGGGLEWISVRPLLAEHLDDCFMVITAADQK